MQNCIQPGFKNSLLFLGLIVSAAGVLLMLHSPRAVADEKKMVEHQKAFAIYQQKCLSCHDSVADPEKPGRTRDDWFLVVNIMHDYGLNLTDQEAAAIVDLLYDLRQGIEKEAG